MPEYLKCAHATCSCRALPGNDYCGDGCRDAVAREESGEQPLSGCKCAHPDCGGAVTIPEELEGLHFASAALAQS